MFRMFKDTIAEPEPEDLIRGVCDLIAEAGILDRGAFTEYYHQFSSDNRLRYPNSYRAINTFFRFIFEKCNIVNGSAHITVTRACYESDAVWLGDIRRIVIPSLRRVENVRGILKDAAQDSVSANVNNRRDHQGNRTDRDHQGKAL